MAVGRIDERLESPHLDAMTTYNDGAERKDGEHERENRPPRCGHRPEHANGQRIAGRYDDDNPSWTVVDSHWPDGNRGRLTREIDMPERPHLPDLPRRDASQDLGCACSDQRVGHLNRCPLTLAGTTRDGTLLP